MNFSLKSVLDALGERAGATFAVVLPGLLGPPCPYLIHVNPA